MLRSRGRTAIASTVLVASTCFVTTATAAPEAAASAPTPKSVNTTVFLPAVGYVRSSVWGVSLDLAEVELAIGYGYQRGAFGLDLGGGIAWIPAGRTEAGRPMHGVLQQPLVLTLHDDWLRFGVGASVGVLAAERATNGDEQSDLVGAAWGAIGVEPFGPAGRPVFVEARLGVMDWGAAAPTASLAIGVRACWFACR